jgi:hypothetical protein
MTAGANLVVFAIVSLSLTFAFMAPSMAVKTFLTQLAYAQSVQTTPPSTSTPTFTPPGSSTPTHTFPTDNNTTATNSTSGNATTTK